MEAILACATYMIGIFYCVTMHPHTPTVTLTTGCWRLSMPIFKRGYGAVRNQPCKSGTRFYIHSSKRNSHSSKNNGNSFNSKGAQKHDPCHSEMSWVSLGDTRRSCFPLMEGGDHQVSHKASPCPASCTSVFSTHEVHAIHSCPPGNLHEDHRCDGITYDAYLQNLH